MAHKTFSQEQFIIKFYKFHIRFSVYGTGASSVNNSLFLLLTLRLSLPVTETNLLFLKRFRLKLFAHDPSFMSLF